MDGPVPAHGPKVAKNIYIPTKAFDARVRDTPRITHQILITVFDSFLRTEYYYGGP